MPFCAEAEGTLDVGALNFLKKLIDEGFERSDGVVSKSVMASQVYARISVALQRANADGVLNWRYTEVGEEVLDAPHDTVAAALNNPPRDLSECDKDLWEAVPVVAAAMLGDTGSV